MTNHMWGEYEGDDMLAKWNSFHKIVAVPSEAALNGGVWYTADGAEIGPSIWGEFAIIQEVYNDTGTGDHGVTYKSPSNAGLGYY